jgi:FKBP-type peptidyl-prolyl cis-trans isomerase
MTVKTIIFACIAAFAITACGNSGSNPNPGSPKAFMDSVSYMIGFNIGQQMAKDSLDIKMDFYIKGLNDAKKHDTTFLSPTAIQGVSVRFQEMLMKKQEEMKKKDEAKLMAEAAGNKEKAVKFLEENKNKPGVKVTETGLQYEVLKEGNGKIPKEDEMVSFHIRAYLTDGKKFDDSYEKNQPIKLGVKSQVKAWQEAFQKMKVGSIWKLYVPPELGWGERGVPPTIPPSTVTIFELELVSIDGKAPDQSKNPAMMPPTEAQPVKPVK